MKKKKHAPIDQLRQMSSFVKQLLVQRGIHTKRSMVDEILNTKGAPQLPGMPAYIPHKFVIRSAQQMFRDFLVMWIEECKKDDSSTRKEDVIEFWKFMVTELRQQEHMINREIVNMPEMVKKMKDIPYIKDVFSPLQKKDVVKAMHRFFVDSFAVAVILKNNTTTSTYANWFLDWTNELYDIWLTPEQKKNEKKY
jgi:hypothetical protein